MDRRLVAYWAALDVLYAAFGLLALLFASALVIVRIQDGDVSDAHPYLTLRRLVISPHILDGGIVVGSLMLASSALGVYAVVRSRTIDRTCTRCLHAFNWSVVGCGIATIVVGVMMWLVTLCPLDKFAVAWQQQSLTSQAWLQDQLSCCGYWNATTPGLFNAESGFCGPVASGTNATAVQPCVVPITAFEDYTLNNIFTTLFGSAAVQVSLVLLTCGIIKRQREEYRFSLIDAKRGGKEGMA